MQQFSESRAAALRRQSGLPALIAIGIVFLFMLSACQVAVADDGSIQIQPEDDNSAAGPNADANGLIRISNQTGEANASAAPINPDQVYEWNGVIRWVDREGGYFVIDRNCDSWAIIPRGDNTDELYGRLKELNGERATAWGKVSLEPNIYGQRAFHLTSVFAPGDIRPLIAVPELPCPEKPAPANSAALLHGEVTLHGDLTWRAGRLWIITERGPVQLMLPRTILDRMPELTRPDAVATGDSIDAEMPEISLGEYGVTGLWDLSNTGLVVTVREINQWPFRTFVRDNCGGYGHFLVPGDQLAVHGTLIINDGQWLMRTKSGLIYIHHSASGANALSSAGEATKPVTSSHEVVVIGQWKTDGTELHVAAEEFVRVKTVCDEPEPPHPVLLPGEIAAPGTLVFVDGKPYLETPQGRILLMRDSNAGVGEPQPIDPAYFREITPETHEMAVAEDGTVRPDISRPARQIIAVGKWQVRQDTLVIIVRYVRAWPYPQTTAVEGISAPLPPVSGGPVKQLPVEPGAAQVDPARPQLNPSAVSPERRNKIGPDDDD